MNFRRVHLNSVAYSLPDEIITTSDIEDRLRPMYERLRLPAGRLELMSGISERRFWPAAMLPSDESIRCGKMAMDAAEMDPNKVGCLIHTSVCRDHLEPATAARVHHELGLPRDCLIYDVSNACLGALNGMLQVANMIELGQIQAGLVVGCESSRSLVERTIDTLNADPSLTRKQIKTAMASLTIGSASYGVLLTSAEFSAQGSALTHAAMGCATQYHELCQSGRDEAVASGMHPLMETDAERLLEQGVAAAAATYEDFQPNLPTEKRRRSVCHQVGSAHRRAVLEQLALSSDDDYVTFHWLGNTGSAALPVSLALAAEDGFLSDNDSVQLLGIGSGINVLMLHIDYQDIGVSGSGGKSGKLKVES